MNTDRTRNLTPQAGGPADAPLSPGDRHETRVRPRRGARPALEACEDRLLLSTFQVTNPNDSGTGSLRQAILDSNADAAQANTIAFDIGGGGLAITPLKPLPAVVTPVTIDGTTQPGYKNAPVVELVGSPQVTTGLNVTGGKTTIEGLSVEKFGTAGVALNGYGGNTVRGNSIGTDVAGVAAAGDGTGVAIASPNNTVGGATPDARNVISGNTTGVSIAGAAATGNVVAGNFIGTDAAGSGRVGNSGVGVYVGAPGTTVGGTAAGAGNVISGNGAGVQVEASGVTVQGNLIGTDAAGLAGMGNAGDGVRVDGPVSNTLVGGTAPGAGNVIAANAGAGVAVAPAKGGPTATTIQGNTIGADVNRGGALPNATGVSVTGATATLVGGTAPGARNFVWNSNHDGIALNDQGGGGNNRVVGNDVQKNGGAGVSLSSASGHDTVAANAITSNAGAGVSLAGSGSVTIGGADASAGNTITGNAVGVKLASSNANTVAFNTITGNAAQGVVVSDAKGDKILSNAITANLGLGIDLDTTAGTTPSNDQIAAPVLLSVTGDAKSKTATGMVFGNPNTPGYTVELFGNPVKTAGVPIQGGVLVGSTTVTTDATGRATFRIPYTPVAGQAAVTATVTDGSSNTSEFSARNAPPTVHVPPGQTVRQDATLVYSAANGNAVSVGDLNAAINPAVQVTLGVDHGTLSLPSLKNLTGSGNGTGALTYTGTVSDLNQALNGLTYAPGAGYSGNATLSVSTGDMAGDELGGTQTAAATSAITVTPVVLSPTVTPAATTANAQTTSGLVITPSATGPAGVAAFQVTGVSNGSVFLHDGTTPVAPGGFVTPAQGAAGLRFTPAGNFVGAAGFTVTASRTADGGGLVGTPAAAAVTVNKAASAVALTGPAGSAAFGAAVNLTATVSPAGATGTVNVFDGATQIASAAVVNGTAAVSVSTLAPGGHGLTATYSGDATYAGSTTTAPFAESVGRMGSQTTLGVSASAPGAGQPLTLTAGVAPASATGAVTFKDGDTVLGTGTVSNGQATFSISTLTPGGHSLTASYPGDANVAPSGSGSAAVRVNPAATATALSLSTAASSVGQAVTLTAKVSPSVKGTVTFLDGTTAIGTAVLNDGTASLSVNTLAPGAHSLTAAYGGDAMNAASASAAATETVSLAQTGTTLSASPSPATVGSAVTLTATVTPATAGGTVTFKDGDATLGTGTVSGGVATFTTTGLAAGSHALTAVYAGDASGAASGSGVVTEQVNPAAASTSVSQTTVAVSPGPAPAGQPVTITASVAAGASAGGIVTFKDGETTLGTSPVTKGVATLSTDKLAPGDHTLVADYSGGTGAAPSASAAVAKQVSSVATATTLTATPNPAAVGQPVTVTVAVSVGPTATGVVTLLDNGSSLGTVTLSGGRGTFTTSSLTRGAHSITAHYPGDGTNAPSDSAALIETVRSVATTTTLTASTPAASAGQAVTLTATVSPPSATGAVTFFDGKLAIGTVMVSEGKAEMTTTTLSPTGHVITAHFDPWGDSSDSTSAPLSLAVSAPALAPAQPAGTVGGPVVTPQAPPPAPPSSLSPRALRLMLQHAQAVQRANALKAHGPAAHPGGPHGHAARPARGHGRSLAVHLAASVDASATYTDGSGTTPMRRKHR